MNTEQLKQAAIKATPGPRVLADHGDYGDYGGNCQVILSGDMRLAVVLGTKAPEMAATAKLMAEATPERILALLECVDALRMYVNKSDQRLKADEEYKIDEAGRAALQKLEALS